MNWCRHHKNHLGLNLTAWPQLKPNSMLCELDGMLLENVLSSVQDLDGHLYLIGITKVCKRWRRICKYNLVARVKVEYLGVHAGSEKEMLHCLSKRFSNIISLNLQMNPQRGGLSWGRSGVSLIGQIVDTCPKLSNLSIPFASTTEMRMLVTGCTQLVASASLAATTQ